MEPYRLCSAQATEEHEDAAKTGSKCEACEKILMKRDANLEPAKRRRRPVNAVDCRSRLQRAAAADGRQVQVFAECFHLKEF
ncbi:hypothetical protein KM043_010599 [Ampulex compressa]|nr:hypothetical protein KM043_010599 [Ampulex compressa]